KTVLSELSRDSYLENHKNAFLLGTQFALLLRQRYPGYSVEEFFAPKTVILINKAQGSYTDYCFWNTIIKERRSGQGKDIKDLSFLFLRKPYNRPGGRPRVVYSSYLWSRATY
ncbi:hypothetical protein P175DRAFT_0403674, partial [Aspergillus ochraceoroseus IBT 24754]